MPNTDCAPHSLMIDDIRYVRDVGQIKDSPIRIVVLQRGWVAVGYYEELENDECILTSASVIRVWGTTNGLGELVHKPLAGTKLDKAGIIRFHKMATVLSMDCEESEWAKVL